MITNVLSIDPNTTVNALLRDRPAVLPVLNAYAIDTCCGGELPLNVAAAFAGIDLEQLLTALAQAAHDDA